MFSASLCRFKRWKSDRARDDPIKGMRGGVGEALNIRHSYVKFFTVGYEVESRIGYMLPGNSELSCIFPFSVQFSSFRSFVISCSWGWYSRICVFYFPAMQGLGISFRISI